VMYTAMQVWTELFLLAPHMLLLDEPTNHLGISCVCVCGGGGVVLWVCVCRGGWGGERERKKKRKRETELFPLDVGKLLLDERTNYLETS